MLLTFTIEAYPILNPSISRTVEYKDRSILSLLSLRNQTEENHVDNQH